MVIKRKGKIIRYKIPKPGEEGEEEYEEYEEVEGPDRKKTIKPKGKTIRLKMVREPGEPGEEVYEIIEGPDGKKIL